MLLKRIIKPTILLLCLCIAAGVGLFSYNAFRSYNISEGFTSLPLNFDPDTSASSYQWNGTDITVSGGFVKGIQKDGTESRLVIRALSPLPSVTLRTSGSAAQTVNLSIENINPDFYAEAIDKQLSPTRITTNTLAFSLQLDAGETRSITPSQPGNAQDGQYMILGDSRDGYETFDQIIAQVNAVKPVFVIDNGDLVLSGQPNQYRLFDQMASGISTTLCTTLGNHDILGNGRDTYRKLYGPEYYSFDFGSNHFVFLDSSRGFAKKQAIPAEQYAWLERDLQKSQGKTIFVISHIPPEDPRKNVKPNQYKAYADKMEQDSGFVEKELEARADNEIIDHGFPTLAEAKKFENLMTKYHVHTLYLSHIHSYFDYTVGGVRYVISGGAGAELLTQNSFYHYLVSRMDSSDTLTKVLLPSPANLLVARYAATASLFANAIFKENTVAISFLIAGLALLVFLLLTLLVIKQHHRLSLLKTLAKDTGKYISQRYHELHK